MPCTVKTAGHSSWLTGEQIAKFGGLVETGPDPAAVLSAEV